MPLKPDLLVWTDGSRHIGTGASGCAVVFGGKLWDDLGGFAVSLGVQPSSDAVECYGHHYALRFALWLHETFCPPREKRLFNNVVIVTDSKLTSNQYDYMLYDADSASAYNRAPETARAVVDLIKQLANLGVGVDIKWERRDSSHGNKEADRLAFVASRKASQGYDVGEWLEEVAVKQQ